MQFVHEFTVWFRDLPILDNFSLAYTRFFLEITGAFCICFLHGFGLFYHEPRGGNQLCIAFHM